MILPAKIITLIGLLITIVGCILIVRKFFLFTSGKAKQYEVSIPGWIITGVGCLICSVFSGHYSAICAWAIWFPIVLITKRKEKCKP